MPLTAKQKREIRELIEAHVTGNSLRCTSVTGNTCIIDANCRDCQAYRRKLKVVEKEEK